MELYEQEAHATEQRGVGCQLLQDPPLGSLTSEQEEREAAERCGPEAVLKPLRTGDV